MEYASNRGGSACWRRRSSTKGTGFPCRECQRQRRNQRRRPGTAAASVERATAAHSAARTGATTVCAPAISRHRKPRQDDRAAPAAAHHRAAAGPAATANYGERYTSGFAAMYQFSQGAVPRPLLPFLLENVALKPDLMQADGLHPNEQGQPLVAGQRLAHTGAAAARTKNPGRSGGG